ncbi:acyl-CoA dehydrogenase family protein [Polynucleobacter sp. AP-Latsch-80-C2]|jgi:alkylation response protein AidB-like acyl-CoA dehydrogenase|uniref:acyl-CoA dehydrogenase family protein n=1 Tax=Polynucleobacter sp. AP-Latsch-80-C2 TaxID=2576931 RepID=UPI001C0CD451|nr:acyl-CoA dehydrogenase family protein [Polynucleobacter sp. AP-Latsch-80-C2]MBU3624471.1 acyl-CoA/acyl-ACP dehydrogenase [Polynucleobacter sp. AP-Latsch-80-C2]
MDNLLKDSLERLLQDLCTPSAIGKVESQGNATAIWNALEESGFADLLVSEESGGAGVSWNDAYALFFLTGQYCLPVSLGATAYARTLLATKGFDPVAGAVSLSCDIHRKQSGQILSRSTPFGKVSDWVMGSIDGKTWLLPVGDAVVQDTGIHGSLQAHLLWERMPTTAIDLGVEESIRNAGALIWTAMMAGAMSEILKIVLVHANDRQQFGKSIGKFQAIQQQISVLAECVQAAAIAAEMTCQSGPDAKNALTIAAGKARVSELALQVNSIAHAVHGAMGITEEFHLHYLTRRLNDWRLDFGSEGYWQEKLGMAYLNSSADGALDFLIQSIDPRERVSHG